MEKQHDVQHVWFVSPMSEEIAFRELSIEKNSRTEMLPGKRRKRDFYHCYKARRSASYK